MIPPTMAASCPSPGEQEIFAKLKQENAAREWIVLHSLDIAQHLRQVSGEADFVIIVPAIGVLCLEVKACRSLDIKDGLWFYGHDPKGDPRGPFKQASEAMHSLRQQVIQSDASLSRVPFWSAVAFPYIEFKVASGEWHPWQVIDSTRFKQQPMATLVGGILRSARSHLSLQPTAKWFRDSDRIPDSKQSAAIARILRPNFEFTEKASDRRARKQAEVIRYTEEQFVALDTMEDNPRVLFTGPAGTGKTLLALEMARRAASAGKSVLFVCFNRLLGRWLSYHPIVRSGQIAAGTLHQYMAGIADIKVPEGADESFWKAELPEAALSKLLDGHRDAARFDMVVADEVQDLLHPQYLDVLELVLKGELSGGSWRMFGDFERQMLYGQDRELAEELIRKRLGSFARGALRVNCRNTPRVATLSQLLGRLRPNYLRILRPDDNIEPAINYYATPSQQRKEISNTLERLFKDSYSGDDIIVLSPKAGQRCAAAGVTEKPWCDQLAPFETAAPGKIRYTTIQSFKGLDAPAIVVTDVEHLDGDTFSSLFYVATTRALERLNIIVHETVKPDIIHSLLGSR
ncbi:MAG: NERD domain-containing protein [Pirellulales bacterium]|nr:NERD domain-containing protein [Pirellulales bacterium]